MHSTDWVDNMVDLHLKYQVRDWVLDPANKDKLNKFLEFRIAFLDEELTETKQAFAEGNCEEIVDGLVDLCVIAIGTLEAFGVNAYDAWNQVLEANMQKEVGVKESRPNELGLPDLIKPEGWVGPDHTGNHGLLPKAFE